MEKELKKSRDFKDKRGNLRRGLKQIHIGNDVWVYGRQKNVPCKGLHMVIYGPDRKEHHVWNDDVQKMCTEYDEYYRVWCSSNNNRHGNGAYHSLVKIYILTSILDNKDNWCFDPNQIPESGPLKVICENGTVKNIEFTGKFFPQELVSKRHTWQKNDQWNYIPHSTMKFVNIVGYRKK